MPYLPISVWLSEKELEEFRKRFQEVSSDPDSVYADDEFCEWLGDILLNCWRREN